MLLPCAMKKVIISIIIPLLVCMHMDGRSPFRKKDPNTPEIIISWKNSPIEIKHANWVYKKYPLFNAFNKNFFYGHLFPKQSIPAQAPSERSFDAAILDKAVNNLVGEIKKHRQTYTDFEVLKDRNFNYKQKCGLLILRFKNYPFVLKL